MSIIFPKLMPPKKMVTTELTHVVLCLTGLYCIKLWPGTGGILLAVLNIVMFNLPFWTVLTGC